MSSLAKEVSLEFSLPSKVMSGLGHLTKSNIDLTNFLRAIENNPTNLPTTQFPTQDSSSITFISNVPLTSSPILTPNQSPPHSKSNSINEIEEDIKPFMIITNDDDKEIIINGNNNVTLEIEVTEADNENKKI